MVFVARNLGQSQATVDQERKYDHVHLSLFVLPIGSDFDGFANEMALKMLLVFCCF